MTASPRRPGQRQRRATHLAFSLLVNELLDGPCTGAELAAITGLSSATVGGIVRNLRAKECLRVVAWERDAHNRQSIAVYQLGRGKDVAKAAPLPRATGRTPFLVLERLAA